MTEIFIDLYGSETDAELRKTSADGTVCFIFSEAVEGFINIAKECFTVSAGKCTARLTYLSDGIYSPVLIKDNRSISLPPIVKDGKVIRLSKCSDEYIRGISKKEHLLEARVNTLEKKLSELSHAVYGTKLFQ